MKRICILTFMSLFLISPHLFTQNIGLGVPVIIAGKENKVLATGLRVFYDSDWGNKSSTTHLSYFLPINRTYNIELTPFDDRGQALSVKTDLSVKTYGFGQSYTMFFLGEYSDDFSLGGNFGGGVMFGKREYNVEEYDNTKYFDPDFNEDIDNIFFNIHLSFGLLGRKEVGPGNIVAMGGYTIAMVEDRGTTDNRYFNDFTGPYFYLAYYFRFDGASRRRSW